MKISKVKQELHRIGTTFPDVGGMLKKSVTVDGQQTTTGHLWAEKMLGLNSVHFENVVDEYVCFARALPDVRSDLPFRIVDVVRNRMVADQERLEQHGRITAAANEKKSAPWRDKVPPDLFARCMKFVIRAPQPPERLKELIDWYERGVIPPRPLWLTGDQRRAFFADDLGAS